MQPTDDMKKGSLVDCLITEPQSFARKYVVAPKVNRRTNAGKEVWAACEEQARANAKTVIPEDWLHTAKAIVARLRNDPVVSIYLRGQGQQPHFWYDTEHEMDCRYLPDIEDPDRGLLVDHPGRGLLVDLKKTRSANPAHFSKQAYSLGYDIQVAHYAEGYRDRYGDYPKQIVLLAYEWEWPYNWSVNVIEDDMLEEGRRRREEAMCLIKECRGRNEWPSWGVHVMNAPRWIRPDDPANDTDADDLELEGLD